VVSRGDVNSTPPIRSGSGFPRAIYSVSCFSSPPCALSLTLPETLFSPHQWPFFGLAFLKKARGIVQVIAQATSVSGFMLIFPCR
jgi:hypothetical protein